MRTIGLHHSLSTYLIFCSELRHGLQLNSLVILAEDSLGDKCERKEILIQ